MDPHTRTILGWVRTWTFLFSLNICLPLFFGTLMTEWGRGRLGMCVGMWVLWAAGAVGGSASRWVRESLPAPAVFLACMQVFPIFQFAAGFAGLAAREVVTGLVPPDSLLPEDEIGFFTATLVTGQLLIGLGLLMACFATRQPSGGR
jgi:hypothetical protein